ncbi:lectin C-type domain protein [Cooperia oncophora]
MLDEECTLQQRTQVFRENATFDEAERRCVLQGGHLVSIHGEMENHFVTVLASGGRQNKSYSEYTWIGLRQKGHPESKEWTWTDGTPVSYMKWSPRQPDNSGNAEGCAHLMDDFSKGTIMGFWNDINCRKKMSQFMCKRSTERKHGK